MVPVPTWRLPAVAALAAVVVVAAPGRGAAVVVVLNVTLLVLAVIDWALAVRPTALEIHRELPAVLTLGGQGEVVWRVGNPGRRRLRVRLADELAPSLRAGSRRARLVVPPRGRALARTTIRPSRRGRFDVVELVVRVEGPLGLVARQGRLRLPSTLRVYPPFRSRQEAELRIARARILEVGLRSAQGRGGGTEFEHLREYTVDDEFRRMDWAATARMGKPIVRTYRAERNQTVLLLLDVGRTMAGLVATDPRGGSRPDTAAERDSLPRLDHALDAVMALTVVATRLGDRAGLVAFADRVEAVVPPGNRRDQLGRVTAALYALQAQLVESDYRGAFAATLARFRRRSLLVVLTELAEAAVTQALLPALPLIARQHVVLVGAVRDPDVDRWARAVPTDPGTAYRKAAAVAALDERRRTIAALRGRGAVVVDAPPGKLAGALADAYLDVKATGRL
ncbi:MAG: DUF58 domain-containing protein [Egibacteraceae bacterium]